LSGRGLCDELITRPEEYYRLCCVVVCDLETSRMGAPYIYDISHLRVNLQVAVYCAIRLHTVYLITFCSRLKSKLLLSVVGMMLDLEIHLLLVFTPC